MWQEPDPDCKSHSRQAFDHDVLTWACFTSTSKAEIAEEEKEATLS
jgi:hypothetical protein